MKITRLGWAGTEVESGGETTGIDLVQDMSSLEPFVGVAKRELLAPSTDQAGSALVTHLHADHTDPALLASFLAEDGVLHRPPAATGEPLEIAATMVAEQGLAETPFTKVEAQPWQSFERGPFTFTAVPAVDGFGDPQVSWVVEADGRRIIHCGDTIFHGSWWLIAMRIGPIDAAFLPVNGPIVSLPHRQPPSRIEAALSPEQAVLAAEILGAARLVPIHYGTIDGPPNYVETEDPLGRVERAAGETGAVEIVVLGEGETLDL